MTPIREIRSTRPEVRSEGAGRFISGYAAVFNTMTDIGGAFLEQIKPGAFSRALKEKQDVRCLLNHDPSQVLGRSKSNTLELKEDSKGLWFRCDVAPTSSGDDLLSLIRRGDIGECSFGFSVAKEDWTQVTTSDGRRDLRSILDCNLYDVSAVCYAQYDGTNVAADQRSSLSFMLPLGLPASAPVELRSRITSMTQRKVTPPVPVARISDEEYLERLRARKQAERLTAGL